MAALAACPPASLTGRVDNRALLAAGQRRRAAVRGLSRVLLRLPLLDEGLPQAPGETSVTDIPHMEPVRPDHRRRPQLPALIPLAHDFKAAKTLRREICGRHIAAKRVAMSWRRRRVDREPLRRLRLTDRVGHSTCTIGADRGRRRFRRIGACPFGTAYSSEWGSATRTTTTADEDGRRIGAGSARSFPFLSRPVDQVRPFSTV